MLDGGLSRSFQYNRQMDKQQAYTALNTDLLC